MNTEQLYCLKAYNQLTVEEWKLGQGVADEEFRARYQAKTPRLTNVERSRRVLAGARKAALEDRVGAQEA